jgi:hypothetical protein
MTKNSKLTGLAGFLLLGILFIGACENNVNTTIEDSIAPYMELQAIEEASNTTITVNRGETKGLDSYFAFDLSNIKANNIVREGLTEGWCLEWDKPIRQNNDVHHGIEMYNTFGSTTWKPANYLMNIVDELKAEDPALTYKEIQVALWTLIETPAFDLDKVLRNGDMPSRLMDDGQPNFDVDKVKAINERVRSEVSEFEYDATSSYILFSNMRDEQNGGIIVTGSQTAWAVKVTDGEVNTTISEETCNNNDVQGDNWGWTNGTYSESEIEHTLDLYAGAGQCDLGRGTFVGTVTFTYNNGELDFTVDLSEVSSFTGELYTLETLQVHVGNNKLPPGSTALYTNAPGQFDHIYNFNANDDISNFQDVIDGLQGDIYIAIHADVLGFDPN